MIVNLANVCMNKENLMKNNFFGKTWNFILKNRAKYENFLVKNLRIFVRELFDSSQIFFTKFS